MSRKYKDISQPKKSRHYNILMHWMSVKLPDNFQTGEHSWPCRFHINGHTRQKTTKTNIAQKHNTENYKDKQYMN